MNEQSLESLCSINPENLGPTTSMDMLFRYLDISAVTEGRIAWSGIRICSFAEAPSRARRLIRTGDVLLCTVRPGLKAHARICHEQSIPLVGSTGFAVLRPNIPDDSGYIFHQLFSDAVAAKLRSLETGSNYPAVNEGDIRQIVLYCPDVDERSRIASVLDTIDEAIAKTEAVIAKLKQVRAGMLHDLLTRGLDENGELRDPLAHPEQFKDSPLGRVPKEWEIEPMGARLKRNAGFLQTGPFGSQLHANEYTSDGVPVIMPQDILEGRFVNDNIAHISDIRANDLRRHFVESGDLIFARRGDLSRCATVTKEEVGWLCGTGCLLMRFKQISLIPEWLSLIYRHDFGQRQVAAQAVGTTMVNLNTQLLQGLIFAFPDKQEQKDIVHLLEQSEAIIRSEVHQSQKLKLLKSGLMADLLTGRVRVPEGIVLPLSPALSH